MRHRLSVGTAVAAFAVASIALAATATAQQQQQYDQQQQFDQQQRQYDQQQQPFDQQQQRFDQQQQQYDQQQPFDQQQQPFDQQQRQQLGEAVHLRGLQAQIREIQPGVLVITQVQPGGPAHQSGLRQGDQLIAIQRQRVISAQDLERQIQQMQQMVEPGRGLALHVRTEGRDRFVEVPLHDQQQQQFQQQQFDQQQFDQQQFDQQQFDQQQFRQNQFQQQPMRPGQQQRMRPGERRQAFRPGERLRYDGLERAALGVTLTDGMRGVRVSRVLWDSPADYAGLRPGDQIVAIDGQPVRSYRDVIRVINQRDPFHQVRLDVMRGGRVFRTGAQLASWQDVFDSPGMRRDQQYLGRRPVQRPQQQQFDQFDQRYDQQQRFDQQQFDDLDREQPERFQQPEFETRRVPPQQQQGELYNNEQQF